jgi:tetraacyldisaccharide 4'-kinase
MREGLAGLKRADIFLLTKVDLSKDQNAVKRLEARLKRINPDALIAKSVHKPECFYKLSNEQLVDIESVRDKRIALVSAIGSPRSFEKTILNLGLKFRKHFVFRDHHRYRSGDLRKIEYYCNKNGIDTVITTEKDAVKLKFFSSSVSFLVLRVGLKITENEQGFHNRLSGIFNS